MINLADFDLILLSHLWVLLLVLVCLYGIGIYFLLST